MYQTMTQKTATSVAVKRENLETTTGIVVITNARNVGLYAEA